ncbi:hypothetical protein AVS_20670 [Aeromonas veronii bv. sobria]|nr:hypothetical protein AVS_20670 [Aeromonas veronii bv. sobria]
MNFLTAVGVIYLWFTFWEYYNGETQARLLFRMRINVYRSAEPKLFLTIIIIQSVIGFALIFFSILYA